MQLTTTTTILLITITPLFQKPPTNSNCKCRDPNACEADSNCKMKEIVHQATIIMWNSSRLTYEGCMENSNQEFITLNLLGTIKKRTV